MNIDNEKGFKLYQYWSSRKKTITIEEMEKKCICRLFTRM